MFLKDALTAQSFDARFWIAGGAYEPLSKPALVELRAENPKEFDSLRAVAEQIAVEGERRLAAEKAAVIAAAAAKAKADQEATRVSRLHRFRNRLPDDLYEAILHHRLERWEPVVAAESWYLDPKRLPWCFLSGCTGGGKSGAVGSIIVNHPGRVEWLSIHDLLRIFTGSFAVERDLQEKIKTCSLLAIEDVGTEKEPWPLVAATLLEVFDSRTSALVSPVIVTTNLTKGVFAKRYPEERLFSRFAKYADWRALLGKDMRRVKP